MSHIVLSLSHLGCRLGLFTAVWRMWFLCRSTFLHVAPVTMKCWLMETVNMREDDTGNVCVCKWESSGAGQPDLSLTSNVCSLKPVLWAVSSQPVDGSSLLPTFISFSSVLVFWFSIFSLSLSHTYLSGILKVQQKGVWEKKNSVVLSNQACFATQQCIPSCLQQFCINFPAVSFLLFSHPNPSQHISQRRDVTHWLTCIPIPCSHTLNGKLHGSVYSSAPLTQNH